ncbi:MAG: hypothetical protein A3J69_01260 [Candidatus Levybacteria bacterium RIFCSPHIGHO2_02_FULL_42_12]|nr:MAG: hypothetical protein A3J69_01260 [Candidatus Levybacteria bacterium RIFCSPHIGHO2_02_FULL_42_12]OGH42925.1 MAG: hypothetical protein A3B53_00255 [Candidatus Levybacteria bacterium RIFCSPLOWO2_01_FULL_42_15]
MYSFIAIENDQKQAFNAIAPHPLQSFEWGEFRKKTGVEVVRRGLMKNGKLIESFQMTLHSIPHLPFRVGYVPKGTMPTPFMIHELKKIGREKRCIFIQLEPHVTKDIKILRDKDSKIVPSAHPLFTKYTFEIDLTKSEDELLKNMHPKTRYNIRVAQKHRVEIREDNSDEAFDEYLRLTGETTKRQGFFAHSQEYHRLMWQTLKTKSDLTAHLLTALYRSKTLVCWILLVFKDTLYYPYGASSSEHKETMASNLMMWEGIKFGKRTGLKTFDMWGALGHDPDKNDPWYGFHRFKEGYGGTLTEFVGNYDLIINPFLYKAYVIADKLRWLFLKLKH